MHPIYRQLISISLCVISLIFTCNKCQSRNERNEKKEWTPELESQIYDVFYSQSANLTTDAVAKKEYADCCLSKIKELFPNGINNPSSDLKDSLKVAALKMGIECAQTLQKHINVWTPESRKQLELQLYAMEESKSLPIKIRKDYIDCVAFELTNKFPTGMGDSNQTAIKKFMTKARKHCLHLVSDKYMKMKRPK